MRFSLYLNPQTHGPQDDNRIITEITRMSRLADAAGFAGIFLTEHHFSNYNTYCDPFIFGAYLAGQMKQAWVILTVAVAPLHNPMNLVERLNLLDQLLSGRLLVAIGSGGAPLEFSGLGRDPDMKAQLLAEVMEVAERAWDHKQGDPPLEYKTTHDRGVMGGRIMPAPFTPAGPRLAMAGLSERTWSAAGEAGHPLVFGRVGPEACRKIMDGYRAALVAAGHSAEAIEFALDWSAITKTVMLGDTDEEANALIQAPLAAIGKLSAAAFTDEQRLKITGIGGPAGGSEFKRAFIEGGTILGSPQTFADDVRRYEDAGIRHLALHFDYGFVDTAVSRRSFDLFVEKVMPQFAEPVRVLQNA